MLHSESVCIQVAMALHCSRPVAGLDLGFDTDSEVRCAND